MAYYRILCDGYPLMDTRLNDYNLISPKCTVELNKTGTLSFDIAPDHPHYDKIHKVSSVITLIEDDEIIFQGRVMDDDVTFDNIKRIECEGELAYLIDSIVRPYTYEGSVDGLVRNLIQSHNEQVEEKKRFTVGQITVTDPNNFVTRASSEYPDTWNEFNDKCVDLLGGYMRLRYTEQATYFDYVENYGNVNQQVIDFGKNILDLSKYVKGADVATRIVPLGATLEDQEGEGVEKRLTIKGINQGKDYVEDADAVELYGVITKVITHDDVTTETVLLQRGYADLAAQKLLQITLEIQALDLHLLDVDVERIKLGDMIRVRSHPHGINEFMLVSKIEMDLDEPGNTQITLGSTFTTLSNEMQGTGNVIADVAEIKQNYVTSGQIEGIQNRIDDVASSSESQIQQTSSEIITQISTDFASKTELESLNEELSSQIKQTDSDIQVIFERSSLYTGQVEEEMRGIYEQILTYYRFDENGAMIGKAGSPFETRIDNQELGFYQDGQRVAYINNQRLYVMDVEVGNVLTIGNYENGYWDWKPRSNGNLSLKWRGGAE